MDSFDPESLIALSSTGAPARSCSHPGLAPSHVGAARRPLRLLRGKRRPKGAKCTRFRGGATAVTAVTREVQAQGRQVQGRRAGGYAGRASPGVRQAQWWRHSSPMRGVSDPVTRLLDVTNHWMFPCPFSWSLPKLLQHRVYLLECVIYLLPHLAASEHHLTRDEDQEDDLGLYHPIDQTGEQFRLILNASINEHSCQL